VTEGTRILVLRSHHSSTHQSTYTRSIAGVVQMSTEIRKRLIIATAATTYFAAGELVSSGLGLWTLLFTLALPLAIILALSRSIAWCYLVSFFLGLFTAANRAWTVFFGWGDRMEGFVLHASLSVALAAMFCLCWWPQPWLRWTATAIGVVSYSLSPVGVGSPALAPGVLLPHPNHNPGSIVGVNTHWGASGSFRFAPMLDYAHLPYMIRTAAVAPGTMTLFPEGTLASYTPQVGDQWFSSDFQALSAKGDTLMFCARYGHSNILFVRGLNSNQYRERYPVPIAMWGKGFPLHTGSPGVLDLQTGTSRIRAGVLICYEQFLFAPVLQSAIEGAGVFLAPSSLYWTRGTNIEKLQNECLESWSRLFRIPVIRAINN
jgi:hypothetical protein